ncbi:MAG: hypothetical protein ACRED5_03825 [Propylenella sp.]
MTAKTISERVEVPSVRPATLRLRWKAEDSYDLYRGSGRLGTARVEENRQWTARFDDNGKAWRATADSAQDLLRLIGVFVLAQEAREAPPAKTALPVEKVPAAERRLSGQWEMLQEKRRLERLDELIGQARRRIVPAKSGSR